MGLPVRAWLRNGLVRAGFVHTPHGQAHAFPLGAGLPDQAVFGGFAELGRVIRTAFLLEYLSSAQLREQITANTNKVEACHRFAKWLFFGGEGLLLEIHPDEQEKRLKYNHLLTNAVAIPNVIDLTRAVRALLAEGYLVKHEDLAALSPYQTRHIKRFGDYVFTVTTPEPFDGELVTLLSRDGSAGHAAIA